MSLNNGNYNVKKGLMLFLFSLTLLSIVFISTFEPNVPLCIIIFSICYFPSWCGSRSLFEPLPFFGLFLYFYVISFPSFILITGFYNVDDEQYFVLLISGFYTYLGLLLAELISGRTYIIKSEPINFQSKSINSLSGVLSVIFAPFFFIAIYEVVISGDVNKYELDTGGIFNALAYYFLAFSFIYIISIKNHLKFKILIFLLLFFLFYLVSGERDFFVRAVLLVLFFLYVTGRVSNKVTIIAFISGLLLSPLSQSLKGMLSYNSKNFDIMSLSDNFFSALFSGEFMSQGRNFYWMLEYKDRMVQTYENMIVNDILRFFKLYEHSSASLFGESVVGRSGGSGVGFSLLGEVYFSFGFLGLSIFGLLIGLFLKRVAKIASESSLNIYLYITILFSCSYALRADFANLLAGVIKIGLLPVITVLVLRYLVNSVNRAR